MQLKRTKHIDHGRNFIRHNLGPEPFTALRTRHPTVPSLKAAKTNKNQQPFWIESPSVGELYWAVVESFKRKGSSTAGRSENLAGLESYAYGTGRSAKAAELRESIICFAVYYPACR